MSQIHTSKDLSESSSKQGQDIFINAPIGIITTTPEGRLLSANPAMAGMFGYNSPDELIASVMGITTQLYADPTDREAFMQLLRENGEVLNYECRGIRRDGSMIWTSRNAMEVRDESGGINHCQVFVTDITDKKELEAALHEKDYALGERVKELQVVYQISDAFGKDLPLEDMFHVAVTAISSGWRYPDATCARITYDNFVVQTENFQKTPLRISRNIVAEGKIKGEICVGCLKNMSGDYSAAFLKEEKYLLDAIAVHLGIMIEHKQALRSLKESEILWRTTLSEVHDTVILTNEEGHITFVCPNVHFIFGHNAEEVFALGNIKNLLPGLEYDERKLEQCGELKNLHLIFTDKDGRKHDGLIGVKKVDFFGHKIMFTVHEATKLMENNRIISRINDPMSLVDADYKYLTVNDAYSRMLGKSWEEIEAHTIEDALGKDIFQNRIRHCLDEAFAGHLRMLNMINMSLSLYQMEKGEYDFHPQPTDVIPIFQDIQRDLSSLCSTREINISVFQAGDGEKDAFVVCGEKLLCYTMFSNLVNLPSPEPAMRKWAHFSC